MLSPVMAYELFFISIPICTVEPGAAWTFGRLIPNSGDWDSAAHGSAPVTAIATVIAPLNSNAAIFFRIFIASSPSSLFQYFIPARIVVGKLIKIILHNILRVLKRDLIISINIH